MSLHLPSNYILKNIPYVIFIVILPPKNILRLFKNIIGFLTNIIELFNEFYSE